jgi:ribosome-binding protein aMBF1 (putative translation factor)
MSKFSEYKQKKLQDSEFKKEYDALETEFDIIQAMIDARKQSGLTQKELAERTGINQADISKLENGTANPSIRTLRRLADGMGMKMKLVFEPLSTH